MTTKNDCTGSEMTLADAQERIIELEDTLLKLLASPLVHTTVVRASNEIDPICFEVNDRVLIIDQDDEFYRRVATIYVKEKEPVVDKQGCVNVIFSDLSVKEYNIKEPQQVKLLGKNDGTNVVLAIDGECVEVWGVPGKKFFPGDSVKVNMTTKAIVDHNGVAGAGEIVKVKTVLPDGALEVEAANFSRVVLNGRPNEKIKPNDRVQLDKSNTVVLRHIIDDDIEYVVTEEITTTWDDIGGCEDAKNAMIEAIELPFAHPDIYKFYNKKLPKGVLLYGAPGCGKTLIGKATANSLATRFGKDYNKTGFIHVKGPELLNEYVGVTERKIRNLFERGRKHFAKTNAPAVLFIDEAEAILPVRGSFRSMDVDRTIVPMFLSEMDGLTENRCIVILATNRPKLLDPAVIRPGRIDRHIKVPRPTPKTSANILDIHLRNIPLHRIKKEEVIENIVEMLFSEKMTLFKIKSQSGDHIMRLSDCLNGAMLATIVEQGVSNALKRDLHAGDKTGVNNEDFMLAVKSMYKGQKDQNHEFDVEDFCELHGIPKEHRIERTKDKI